MGVNHVIVRWVSKCNDNVLQEFLVCYALQLIVVCVLIVVALFLNGCCNYLQCCNVQ